MQEIRCPNCGKVFQVDESGYAQILRQVRDREFENDLSRREKELSEKADRDHTIAQMKQEQHFHDLLSAKDAALSEKGHQIEQLNALLHEYGEWIIGRMGIPYRQKKINIISIAIDAPQDTIAALSGKIGNLPGVSAKTVYSNVTGTR